MASFNDFLARWLARRLKKSGSEASLSDMERGALLAHLEKTRKQVVRLKESAEEREKRHQTLKRRHDDLKKQLLLTKEEARMAKNQAGDLSAQNTLLREQVDALTSMVTGDDLEHARGIPIETKPDAAFWSRYLKRRRSIWKYPMRLDVLRQHEPKPVEEQNLPEISPPGTPDTWPLVSIVTPSFQQAAFIERTMASVLSQDYPRLEYRVIDGGSTDASVAVIEKVADRLAGWESRPDNGPASAINRGFEQSHGEIMAWLNSDDLLLPGVVRRVAAWFARHPEVDVIYGNRIVIDERDRQVGRWVLPPHDDEALLWVDYVPQETLFWRRCLWERVGGRIDEGFQFAFDWDLLLRFQKAGARMVRVPWFLGCFRVHDAQKTSAVFDSLGVAEITRIRQRELGPSLRGLRLDRQAIRFQERAIWHDRLLRLGIRLSAFFPTARRPLPISSIAPIAPRPTVIKRRFCTYFDLQYAAAGIAMLHSLLRHSPGAEITVLCLENGLASVLEAEFGKSLKLMLMSELESAQPALASVPAHDELWERYAMIKPFLIDCLLPGLPDNEILTFIDADIFLFADPEPLFAELDTGSVAISPHRFNEDSQILSRYGTYNAGFSLWRQDKTARRIVREWRDECATWCRNSPEPDGRFMDQGYLTKWPERYPGVVVLGHPGENLAPWNVGSHQLTFDGSRVRVDGCLLIFFHFSGLLLGPDDRWRTYYNNPAVAQRLVLDRIFRPYLETVNAISERLRERHGVDGRGSVRDLHQHASLLDLQPYLVPEAPPVMVWLASFPRCGNKLARLILSLQFDATTFTVYSQLGEPDEVPVTPHWAGDLPSALPVPESGDAAACFFMKTHELPASGHPAIYVIRDGRDAYVSYAHFVRQHFPTQVEGMSFEQVLEMLIRSKAHFAGWSDHARAWAGRKEPTAVIRFEDMISDPAAAMSEACLKLGIKLPPPSRSLPGFEALRAREPAQFRKGKAGSWREEMPPDLEALFWSLHGDTMTTFGYDRGL